MLPPTKGQKGEYYRVELDDEVNADSTTAVVSLRGQIDE